MKNMIKLCLAVLATSAALPAHAQDAPIFTGPRIEGLFGYEFVSASPRNTQDFHGRGLFGDDSINEDVTYGVEAGYDVQVGGFVVGAYAGGLFGESIVDAAGRPYQFRTGRNITAGLRAGLPTRGVLLYGKAGLSNGRLKEELLAGGTAATFTNYERNRNGFHVGGGVEIPLIEGFHTKVDYSYHQYRKVEIGTTDRLEFSRHQIVTGIGYRF